MKDEGSLFAIFLWSFVIFHLSVLSGSLAESVQFSGREMKNKKWAMENEK